MEESTTGQVVDTSVADNSSTTETTTNPAEQSVQEATNSGDVSTQSAGQNNQTESEDADLAKFASGQGITDLSELSERERSLLKMARDNKSAYDKFKQNQPKLDEASTSLASLGDEATDIQKLSAKVANMEFAAKKGKFFEGKDASLEPVMSQIIAEKRQEFGDDYARNLLSDLPTLYSLAQLQKPNDTSAIVAAAKQEERNSMNQSLSASASSTRAMDSKPQSPTKITNEWIRNEYDPSNPEHRALVDAYINK